MHRFGDKRVGGKMHYRLRTRARKRSLGFIPVRKAAFDKAGARIDGPAMPYREVIEDRDLVAFIAERLGANASAIAAAAHDENLHSRKVGRRPRESIQSAGCSFPS